MANTLIGEPSALACPARLAQRLAVIDQQLHHLFDL